MRKKLKLVIVGEEYIKDARDVCRQVQDIVRTSDIQNLSFEWRQIPHRTKTGKQDYVLPSGYTKKDIKFLYIFQDKEGAMYETLKSEKRIFRVIHRDDIKDSTGLILKFINK